MGPTSTLVEMAHGWHHLNGQGCARHSDRIRPPSSPCFSLPGTNPAMPFSVQGLVLGAPEACSQSPSSQPSRGLLPCTAPQPQPQGLAPTAQQPPAMSNHMLSQVSRCAVSRAPEAPRARGWEAEAERKREGPIGKRRVEEGRRQRDRPGGQCHTQQSGVNTKVALSRHCWPSLAFGALCHCSCQARAALWTCSAFHKATGWAVCLHRKTNAPPCSGLCAFHPPAVPPLCVCSWLT